MMEAFFDRKDMYMERTLPKVSYQEVLHYLGCQTADDLLDQQIRQAMMTLEQLAKPKIVYQITDIVDRDSILGIPLIGKDIHTLLKTCDQAICMALTLGTAVDVETKRLSIKDMGAMLVFDAVCNAGIEALANAFQEELRRSYLVKKRYLSDRFSCGYGDFDISVQKKFCEALDTKRKIGVFVNESSLLIPLKSVTAIIGISNQRQPKRITGCEHCDLKETCVLRKGGMSCGNK